ncbi:hypothetical protein VdG1_06327 [Verticillium dahliae VDG1]|nr:hypothetical protein VdG1_06327 [Verticillium dahliae VDG1]
MSLLAQGIVGGIVGITTTSAIISLRVATNIFLAASDTAIVDTLLQLIHRSLEALTQSLSGAALIWRGIFTNGTNDTSVHFILNHLSELFAFLYDMFKPANVIPRFPIGFGNGQENASVDNPYNELDLRREERETPPSLHLPVPRGGLGDLQMNARLRSDFDKANNPPPPTYDARLEHGQKPIYPDERVDWRVLDGGEVRPLSAYARVTEHFAHRADFVAMLGCVTQAAGAESGYAGAPVFFSNGGRGHLFGAHYSLGAESYVDGDNSKLLKAVAGRPLWLEE